MAEKPHRWRVDTDIIPVEERADLARTFLTDEFIVGELPGDPPRIGGAADFWFVDNLTAARNQCITARVARKQQKENKGAVRLRLVTGGRAEGIMNGEPVVLSPGDLVFDAFDVGFALNLDAFSCDVVGLPSLSAGYDPARHHSFKIIATDTPVGSILAHAMQAFFDAIDEADLNDARAMSNCLIGLIEGLVKNLSIEDNEGKGRQAQRLIAMQSYIEHHLGDQGLDIAKLIQEFGASRSVIYRLFRNKGGLNKYILGRRLSRAATLLAFAEEDASIADVTRSVGLGDQRHFARQFRERFGMAPSDARATFRIEGQTGTSTKSSEARNLAKQLKAMMAHDARDA